MSHTIYMYENRVTGKIYIGQAADLKNRDSVHTSNKRNDSLIDKKIRQYGRDNFELWTITLVDTKEQANQEEIFWIAEMRKQLGRNMVYNLTDGGDGVFGYKHSVEQLQKMSESHVGHIHTAEHKRKIQLSSPKGEKNHSAKLTEALVKQIRELYVTGLYSQSKLSYLFDVVQSVIGKIIRRELWRHVQ